jgi:hypothetical protein
MNRPLQHFVFGAPGSRWQNQRDRTDNAQQAAQSIVDETLDLMKFVISAFIGANKSKSENKSNFHFDKSTVRHPPVMMEEIYFCPIVVWSSDEVLNVGKIAEHSFY